VATELESVTLQTVGACIGFVPILGKMLEVGIVYACTSGAPKGTTTQQLPSRPFHPPKAGSKHPQTLERWGSGASGQGTPTVHASSSSSKGWVLPSSSPSCRRYFHSLLRRLKLNLLILFSGGAVEPPVKGRQRLTYSSSSSKGWVLTSSCSSCSSFPSSSFSAPGLLERLREGLLLLLLLLAGILLPLLLFLLAGLLLLLLLLLLLC